MVVSDATRARARRENAPAVGPSAPPTAEDASESSRAGPRAGGALQQEPPAYVTVDALRGLMSTMADAITRQVTEQVQRSLGVNGARNLLDPPPHLRSRAESPREESRSLRSRGLAREERSHQVPPPQGRAAEGPCLSRYGRSVGAQTLSSLGYRLDSLRHSFAAVRMASGTGTHFPAHARAVVRSAPQPRTP